jgi:hypothetical protein
MMILNDKVVLAMQYGERKRPEPWQGGVIKVQVLNDKVVLAAVRGA